MGYMDLFTQQRNSDTLSGLRDFLDAEAARINSVDFIAGDPVQFPRQFEDQRDIEITSLIVSTIAWGNRKMICADCGKMLALMGHDPYCYVMERGYEDLPDMNIHRTFFAANLRNYLRGLNLIYARHGSLENYALSLGAPASEFPAWDIAAGINAVIAEANNGKADSRCMPQDLAASALKRLNMALRWLVRNDGIVDLGVWKALRPSQLFIPLDVHVGNVSRELGILTRKSNDRKSVIELTSLLRTFRPDDPVIYDFALFGIGIESRNSAVAMNDGN